MFNENMAMLIALRAMDVIPTYPLLIPVRAKNPRGARGASRSSRIRASGPALSAQADESGE